MSEIKKSASKSGRRKRKYFSSHKTLNESEVSNKNCSEEIIKENVFANVTHKNASGANNWEKFSKLSQNNKDCKNSQKPFSKKNTQKPFLNKNYVSNPTLTLTLDTKQQLLQSKPNKIITSNIGATNQRQGSKKFSDTPIIVTDTLEESKISSKTDDFKPKLTKHIAMDCEMVGVEIGVNKSMLARISLVNSHGDCIYDKFVKPTEPVLDYRTRVSGVRPRDLESGEDFKIVQKEVADILKSRILVGHALKNDLKVLYLSHPKFSMRDTSKFHKFREGKTPALRKLVKKYLGATIQEGEHSSVQDALAAMQLYKMFKKEWETSVHSKKHQIKKCEKNKPLQLSKESVGSYLA